jgi:sec-independent protein translocase protein TatA
MDLGIGELVVILLVVLLFFGAKRLPALGEGLGKAVRGIKQGISGERSPKDGPPGGTGPGERKD